MLLSPLITRHFVDKSWRASLSLRLSKRNLIASMLARNDANFKHRVVTMATAASSSSTVSAEKPASHARMFTLERYLAAALVPLLPAAYFIHTPAMDYALALAIGLHIHWGLEAVMVDYARPFVVGEQLSKLCHYAVYLISALAIAALLHFNYHDVGITQAFEMIWDI